MATFPNFFAPQTQVGANLSGLVSALYAQDSPNKAAEREAMLEEKRMNAALKARQIKEYELKEQKASEERAARATAPLAIAEGFFPGQGQAVTDYRTAGGMVPPQPETAEVPGIVGGYEMDRPKGYTPQAEEMLNRIMGGIAASGALPGKTTFEDLAKGGGALQNQDIISQVLAGLRTPETAGAAVAAGGGKPLYDDNQGRVLNRYSGMLDETGGQAQANVGETRAKTGRENAQAAKYGREGVNVETVYDATSPTGFRYVDRRKAIGQAAPLKGAARVADALFQPAKPVVASGQRELAAIENTRSTIKRFNEAATADERNFGLSGFLRETVQDAMQQGKALALTVGSAADRAVAEINAVGHEVGLENFDKNLPLLDMYANVLAFQLAQSLAPGDRVTERDFKTFRSLIGDSGVLGNQAAVRERMAGIEAMLTDKERTVRRVLGNQAQPAAPASAGPEPTATDARGRKVVYRNGQWQPLSP